MTMNKKEFEQFLENINFKNPIQVDFGYSIDTYYININDFSVGIRIDTDSKNGKRISTAVTQDTFDGFAKFLKAVIPYQGEEI